MADTGRRLWDNKDSVNQEDAMSTNRLANYKLCHEHLGLQTWKVARWKRSPVRLVDTVVKYGV